MMRQIGFALVLLGVSTLAGAQTVTEARPAFTAKDWASLHSAHAAAVAPNTGAVLYQVSFGGDEGPTHTEWWMVNRDGTGKHKLDLPKDFRPMGFTREGNALYGSYHVGKLPQFAVFSLQGVTPEATPSTVVMLPRGIRSAVPSPDGSRYAILFDPRPPDPLAEVRTVLEPGQTGVYVVHADGTGGQHWCEGLTQVSEVAWSPDGASLAVLSGTPKIGFHSVRSFLDTCSEQNSHRVAEIANAAANIAWTGDGEQIAFLSTTTHVLTPDHVWTVAVAGGAPVDRTPALHGSSMALAGDPHGKVWVMVNHGVRGEVDEFSHGALTTAYTWPTGSVEGVPVFSRFTNAEDDLAFNVGDPQHATNVAVNVAASVAADVAGKLQAVTRENLKKITDEGDKELSTIDMGPVRVVHWTSKEGIALEGIATFPAGYVAGKKYPFLVLPHGGPEANDMLALDPFSRTIAGLGYVVLQPEYRGSTGFGTDFLEAIYQHFGDRAYRDVDSATDYAIAQGWADPHRLAIFGWSAGGFMTSWTVTQTNRYRAAVEGAGITDWGSFMWTSDIAQFDYDARWPEDNPEAFRRFSAVDYASKVTTPLLILHGAADERVPTYQGREYFEILAARGKTVRMVTYPGSPHFPILWQQRLNVMHEVADWLARYNP
jgi:dipeptidyl aminopeptidase/acylaminoacyl peptidase